MLGERRRHFRFPLPSDEQQAVFQLGKLKWNVEVVDGSSGGFSVLLPLDATVEIGQAVMLRQDGVWHEMRVANIAEEEKQRRVGLSRISDVAHPGAKPPAHTGEVAPSRGRRILAVGGAIAALIVLLWVVVAERKTSALPPPRPTVDSWTQRWRRANALATLDPALTRSIDRLWQLTQPEAAEKLKLDPAQQAEVNRIVNELTDELAELYLRGDFKSTEAVGLKAAARVRAAQVELDGMLSEPQRASLSAMR
jgi:hypothetical protein